MEQMEQTMETIQTTKKSGKKKKIIIGVIIFLLLGGVTSIFEEDPCKIVENHIENSTDWEVLRTKVLADFDSALEEGGYDDNSAYNLWFIAAECRNESYTYTICYLYNESDEPTGLLVGVEFDSGEIIGTAYDDIPATMKPGQVYDWANSQLQIVKSFGF